MIINHEMTISLLLHIFVIYIHNKNNISETMSQYNKIKKKNT